MSGSGDRSPSFGTSSSASSGGLDELLLRYASGERTSSSSAIDDDGIGIETTTTRRALSSLFGGGSEDDRGGDGGEGGREEKKDDGDYLELEIDIDRAVDDDNRTERGGGDGDGGGRGGRQGSESGGEDEDDEEDPWKNRNVRLSLVLCAVQGVADSIWGAVVLSGFLYALGKAMGKSEEDNTLVGAAEAVQGLTQLLFALPIGVLADRIGKAKVVRSGAGLVVVAIGVTLWALNAAVRGGNDGSTKDATASYVLMLVALGLWGVVGGITNGPSQALFADSVGKGRRSEMLTWLYSGYLVSSVVGPVVGVVLTLTAVSSDAEDWSLEELYPVFFAGVCLELPVAVIMLFFSDHHVVKEDEQEGTAEGDAEKDNQNTDEADNGASSEDDSQAPEATVSSKCLNQASVPYVLFLHSLVMALASGASVKYFPLFFKELGLTDAEVQIVFAAVPLSIAAFSFVCQRLSTRLGRIEASVLLDLIGVSLLFLMTFLSRNESNLASADKGLIVVVYLLRTGIMNGSYPLLESILMDAIPSNRRARWKSLESIASFGWTGSALAGGILSDGHSYRFTFAITASMQLFGTVLLLPIRPFVESEQQQRRVAAVPDDDRRRPAATEEGENDLSEPLI